MERRVLQGCLRGQGWGMMEMGDAEPRTMLCLVRRPDTAKGREEQIKLIKRCIYSKVCILFIVIKMQH